MAMAMVCPSVTPFINSTKNVMAPAESRPASSQTYTERLRPRMKANRSQPDLSALAGSLPALPTGASVPPAWSSALRHASYSASSMADDAPFAQSTSA